MNRYDADIVRFSKAVDKARAEMTAAVNHYVLASIALALAAERKERAEERAQEFEQLLE